MQLVSFERFLRAFNKRAPFRPYFIELVSGDRVQVRHPEAFDRLGDIFIFRSPNRELKLFEVEAVVQFIDPAPASS